VAPPIGGFVKVLLAWLVRTCGNDGFDPPPPTPPPDARIAIPLVASESPWPATLAAAAVKEPTGHCGLERSALMGLPGGEMDGDDETVAVTNQMDLRGTDHENRATIDREDGATRGVPVRLPKISAYRHAARHAVKSAE
jgi:hypothetical protein